MIELKLSYMMVSLSIFFIILLLYCSWFVYKNMKNLVQILHEKYNLEQKVEQLENKIIRLNEHISVQNESILNLKKLESYSLSLEKSLKELKNE